MKIRDETDGTSNTFAIGEAIRRDIDGNLQTFVAGEYVGARWFGIAADDRQTAAVGQLAVPPSTFAINGASINAFASQHVGGAHFLLTDGTVRFLNENINHRTYQSLGGRRDSKPVGEF